MKSELLRSIRRRKIRDLLRFLFCSCMIILIMAGFLCRTIVDGHSMDSTLHDGQNLLLVSTKLNPKLKVRNSDIVIAKLDDITIIKRVIGCPGDTIAIQNGQVYLNGALLYEPYINEPMQAQDMAPITLGEEEYFLMGDNRNHSADSRRFGTFSREDFLGVVYLDQQILLLIVMVVFVACFAVMACMPLISEEEEERYV